MRSKKDKCYTHRQQYLSLLVNKVQLIYTVKTHINHQFLKAFNEKLKKLSKKCITFSIFHKRFLKIIYQHIY